MREDGLIAKHKLINRLFMGRVGSDRGLCYPTHCHSLAGCRLHEHLCTEEIAACLWIVQYTCTQKKLARTDRLQKKKKNMTSGQRESKKDGFSVEERFESCQKERHRRRSQSTARRRIHVIKFLPLIYFLLLFFLSLQQPSSGGFCIRFVKLFY